MQKAIYFALAVLCLLAVGYTQGSKANPGTAHYTMFSASVRAETENRGEAVSNEVFMLETESGKVWRYEADRTGQDGDKRYFMPAGFVPLPFFEGTRPHHEINPIR